MVIGTEAIGISDCRKILLLVLLSGAVILVDLFDEVVEGRSAPCPELAGGLDQ